MASTINILGESLTAAVNRVSQVLFKPFDLRTYLVFAVGAWLSSCSTPNFSVSNRQADWEVSQANLQWIYDNPVVAGLGAVAGGGLWTFVLLVVLAFWGIAMVLSSRGVLMLVVGLRSGVPDLDHWNQVGTAASVLAWFRFKLGGAALFCVWLLSVIFAVVGLSSSAAGAPDHIRPLVNMLFLPALPFFTAVWFVDFLARELAAPVLLLEPDRGVLGALRVVFQTVGAGSILAFLIARWLLAVGFGLLSFVLGWCLFLVWWVPGVWAVIFLPIILALRAFSLAWLARHDARFADLGWGAPTRG